MKHLLNILYFLLLCVAILTIDMFSPTNMAGPGLDIVVYFIAILIGIILFIRNIMKIRHENRSSYIAFGISAIGLLGVILMVYYEWTKKN
jgi:hypothetical protein